MSAEVMLSVQGVTKLFPNVVALDNVSFDIYKGQVHGIVGENGAGKSTLMKILSGVYKKDQGKIYFDGQEMKIKRPIESLTLGLSIIYQEFNLVNQMTVGENIFLGRFKELGGMKKVHEKARELLDSIGSKMSTYTPVENLSVSEKQAVEICKALSYNAKLIIMDEPSTTLTAEDMARLTAIIRDLKAKGVTIIYISHRLDEIFDLCDRVTVMRDGKVISTKPIEEVTRPTMIAEMVGRLSAGKLSSSPILRRTNRIRTIQGTLAIEQNTLSVEQVTAVLNGKHAIAPPRDSVEVKNAYNIYETMAELDPYSVDSVVAALGTMMHGLIDEAGLF